MNSIRVAKDVTSLYFSETGANIQGQRFKLSGLLTCTQPDRLPVPTLLLHVSDANCPSTGARFFQSLLKGLLRACCVPGPTFQGLVKERQTFRTTGPKEEVVWRGERTGEEGPGGRRDLVLLGVLSRSLRSACLCQAQKTEMLQGPEKREECA